ncbi:MAG: hypothetical protein ABIA78_04165 [archaeon]
MGAISFTFGKLNYVIGEGLKFFLPHKWLRARAPYNKVENKYIIYGLGGYVFGALKKLGNRFLFPGLKPIKELPGGLVENTFSNIPATTSEGLDMNLKGIVGLEILGTKGAARYYESDVNFGYITELITRHTASEMGKYSERGIEEKIPKIGKEVVKYYSEGEGKEEIDSFGVKLHSLALNSLFDEDSQNNRYERAVLNAQIAREEGKGQADKMREIALGEYDQQIIQAEIPVKTWEIIYDALKKSREERELPVDKELLDGRSHGMYDDQRLFEYSQNGTVIVDSKKYGNIIPLNRNPYIPGQNTAQANLEGMLT